jgi:hypothetical protein
MHLGAMIFHSTTVSHFSPSDSSTGLDTGVTYQVLVYASNSKGRSKPMFLQANTLSEPEKQLPSEISK